jgi:hypothetical protein
VYPIPCGDFVSQLVLPRDLSQAEADRFCTLIQTLVTPNARHRNTERNDGGSAAVLAILRGSAKVCEETGSPSAAISMVKIIGSRKYEA